MAGLDYPGMMRAAITPVVAGGLGLIPAQFWALTPIELQMMLGRETGAMMTRARLNDMAALYPDVGRKDKA